MQTAAHAYLATQVNTTNQGDLLLMLYDAAIKFLKQAKVQIEKRDYAQKGILISRALDIVGELSKSLNQNQGGDLAANLLHLYFYCQSKLLKANLKLDTALIDEVIDILAGLRSAFAEIVPQHGGKAPKPQETPSANPKTAPAPQPLVTLQQQESQPADKGASTRPKASGLKIAAKSASGAAGSYAGKAATKSAAHATTPPSEHPTKSQPGPAASVANQRKAPTAPKGQARPRPESPLGVYAKPKPQAANTAMDGLKGDAPSKAVAPHSPQGTDAQQPKQAAPGKMYHPQDGEPLGPAAQEQGPITSLPASDEGKASHSPSLRRAANAYINAR
jgi:flagellar protein FliS